MSALDAQVPAGPATVAGPVTPPSGSTSPGGAAHAAVDAADVRDRVVTGVGMVAIRGLLIRAIGLVGNIVLARLLVPREFGVLAFGLTLQSFSNLLTDVGIAAQLIRGEEEPSSEQLETLLAFQLLTSVAVAGMVSALFAYRGTTGAVASIFVWSLVVQCVRGPAYVSLERHLVYRITAFADVLEVVVYTVASIGLVVAGFGVYGVAAAAVLRVASSSGYLLARSPVGLVKPYLHLDCLRRMIGFGARFQLSSVIDVMRDQFINYGTDLIAGASVLGFWSLTQRIMLIPYLIFESLWRVSFPGIARLLDHGEDPRPDIERALRLAAVVTAIVLASLASTAPLIITPIFGAKWQAIAAIIPPSSLGLLFLGPLSAAGAGYLYATGHAQRVLVAMLVTLVTWLVLLPILLPHLGIKAHGIIWLCAQLGEGTVFAWSLSRMVKIPVVRIMAPSILGFAAVVGAFHLIERHEGSSLSIGIAYGLIAALVTTGILALFQRSAVVDIGRLGRRMVVAIVPRRHAV